MGSDLEKAAPQQISPYFVAVGPIAIDIKALAADASQSRTASEGEVTLSPGGTARNIAENLARLNSRVSLLGVIGNDIVGHLLVQHAEQAGVDTSHVAMIDAATSCAHVSFARDRTQEPSIVYNFDILNHITPAYIISQADVFQLASCVVLTYHRGMHAGLLHGWNAGLFGKSSTIALCTKETDIFYLGDMWMQVDWLFLNALEARALLGDLGEGIRGIAVAAQELRRRGPSVVVVTLGSEGLVVDCADGTFHISGPTVAVRDTTGAGDSLAAAFCHAMLRGRSHVESGIFAAATAALTVSSKESVRSDLTEAMVQNYRSTHIFSARNMLGSVTQTAD